MSKEDQYFDQMVKYIESYFDDKLFLIFYKSLPISFDQVSMIRKFAKAGENHVYLNRVLNQRFAQYTYQELNEYSNFPKAGIDVSFKK